MNVPLAIAVADDHLLPQRLGVEAGMVGLRADRGRVDQDLGARQRVGSREFRKPLVPARRAARAAPRRPSVGSGVSANASVRRRARAEVAVLVVAGGHRDVELARARESCPSGRHDDGRVVAQPVGPSGPSARSNSEACTYTPVSAASCRANETVGPDCRSSGCGPDGLRAVGGDREVRRQRQLLQADDPRALAGGDRDPGRRAPLQVLVGVGVPALLHEPEPQRRALGRAGARRRRAAAGTAVQQQRRLSHRAPAPAG